MSKGGSAPAPIPESEYSKTMARIADEQYNYYKSNYKPFEDGLIAKSKENPLAMLGRVNDSFTAGSAMTNGMADRSLSRVGVAPMPAQLQDMSRRNSLNMAAATGKGVTDYATNAINQNTALQGMLAGMGKKAVGQASDGLGTANSNYMAQQQQHQQAVMAQNQANQAQQNTIISAGLGAAMMF